MECKCRLAQFFFFFFLGDSAFILKLQLNFLVLQPNYFTTFGLSITILMVYGKMWKIIFQNQVKYIIIYCALKAAKPIYYHKTAYF